MSLSSAAPVLVLAGGNAFHLRHGQYLTYVVRNRLEDCGVWLDLLAATFVGAGRPVVEHYQNAFDSPL